MFNISKETKTSFNFVISFQPSALIDNRGILAHDNKTSFDRYHKPIMLNLNHRFITTLCVPVHHLRNSMFILQFSYTPRVDSERLSETAHFIFKKTYTCVIELLAGPTQKTLKAG